MLRILTGHANDIATRAKNYEYRRYQLDSQVRFIWLYENELQAIWYKPLSRCCSFETLSWLLMVPTNEHIRYIMTTATSKRPGEVNDPTSKGNISFDKGCKTSKFGYPIKELYQLPSPTNSDALKHNFGMDMSKG